MKKHRFIRAQDEDAVADLLDAMSQTCSNFVIQDVGVTPHTAGGPASTYWAFVRWYEPDDTLNTNEIVNGQPVFTIY